MHDNPRDSYGNRNQDYDNRSDDPAARWRRGEDRYRREASGSGYSGYNRERFGDDDRFDRDRNREFGFGQGYRDDNYGGRGSAGRGWSSETGRASHDYYSGRDYARDEGHSAHWHERDHDRRAGHPYSGTYGGTGDSTWFTGTQGSWAVSPSDTRARGAYGGGQSYGSDYRSHGWEDRDDRRGFWDRASDEVASWFGDEDAARRREQDHRGRGPKDYTRSDERIREDANDRLTEDWRVDASNVTVTVQNGEITLNGTVTSREAKRRAEDVVDNISGVKHVQNNLRVQEATQASNWTTNRTSTAEGGVASQSASEAAKQASKV